MARRLRLRLEKRLTRLEKSAFLWPDRFSGPQILDSDPENLAELLAVVAATPGLETVIGDRADVFSSEAFSDRKALTPPKQQAVS